MRSDDRKPRLTVEDDDGGNETHTDTSHSSSRADEGKTRRFDNLNDDTDSVDCGYSSAWGQEADQMKRLTNATDNDYNNT